MGSASSQLKATQPVTPSQKQALTAKALPENELEAQPSIEEGFCPVQSALRKASPLVPSARPSSSTDTFVREEHEIDAVAEQADMAKKNKDKRTSSRPTTPVGAANDSGDQDVSMVLDEPNTQLRREMMLSQQQHDARADEAGENRQDESPAKKKKERKKKKIVEGADVLMEQAESAGPESVQAAEVAQSAPQSKKRKRKSKADREAQADVEEDTIRVGGSSGWQAVNANGNGSENNDEDNTEKHNDETEQPPAKKRKRKSKAATKEVDNPIADRGTVSVNAAEDKVPAERPKLKWTKKRQRDAAAAAARPSSEGVSGLPRSGAFTPIETELIATTVDDFRQVNALNEHEFNAMVQVGTKKSNELKELVADILQTLPNRNSQAIRRFLERKYHNCQRGPWSDEEDEELRLAFADHPNEWKKIGGRLNRMAEDCRDRWRNHAQYSKEQRKTDIWTPEEEQELLDAIETCISRMQASGEIAADVQSSQIPEDAIQWKIVSEIMDGKRNRLQCSYKWKKLKYRAWRRQQAANGTLPARRQPQRTNENWISAERVTAEDDEDDEAGDPEVYEAPVEEDAEDVVVNDAAAEDFDFGPELESVYRANNLEGIARDPEESIERHTRWHQRYDVGDWYCMLREMHEIYNDFRSAGKFRDGHLQYWDFVDISFDHGHWDNDDRKRSLDRCCRGLGLPKAGLGEELHSSIVILEERSSTRDLERTVMGRRKWAALHVDKQYRTPSDSDRSARPRTPTPQGPLFDQGAPAEPAQEEPAVESEAVEPSDDEAPIAVGSEAVEPSDDEEPTAVESERVESADDNEPIDVATDTLEDAPPAATLDENDPTFWDPISPPSQAPQLTTSKNTPRTERVEAGPSKSSLVKKTPHADPAEPSSSKSTSTKKRASYGKMSKHKWAPAKSFYEDENDPIEDSQAAATAGVQAQANADAEAENDVDQTAVEVVKSTPQVGNDAAAGRPEGAATAVVERAAAQEADAANGAQSNWNKPAKHRKFRPLATQSQEVANDLRPFDQASLDARGADQATSAGHYVLYEPTFDRHSSEDEDEESQDSSDLDPMAVDEPVTARQSQNAVAAAKEERQAEAAEEEAQIGPLADASDDEEEIRKSRLRDVAAERDDGGVEDVIAVAAPDEDEDMEDASTDDHEKEAAVDASDDDSDDDDDREEVIRVAPKLEADAEESDAEDSDEENNSVAAAADDEDDPIEDENEDDEQKPALSRSVVMAEPELRSPFRSQSPETVVRNTQARSISSRTSSVVSSDSEDEAEVRDTQPRTSSSSRSSSVISSDSEEDVKAENARPRANGSNTSSSRTSSVVSSDSEEDLHPETTQPQSMSSTRSSSVVSSDSEEEVKAGDTRPRSISSSRSSSVVSSDSEEGEVETEQARKSISSDRMSTQSDDELPKLSVVPVTQTGTGKQSTQKPTTSEKQSKATGKVNRVPVKQESKFIPQSSSEDEFATTEKARRLAKMRRKRRDEDLDLGSVNGR